MDKKELQKQTAEELALIVMYLCRWREIDRFSSEEDLWRCFKMYDFNILNSLDNQGLIYNASHRSKSFTITKEGEAKVLELIKKYNIDKEII